MMALPWLCTRNENTQSSVDLILDFRAGAGYACSTSVAYTTTQDIVDLTAPSGKYFMRTEYKNDTHIFSGIDRVDRI